MQINDKIVVVTGAASGIGRALARRFRGEGARLVVCSDLAGDGAQAVADEIGGVAFRTNVALQKEWRQSDEPATLGFRAPQKMTLTPHMRSNLA